jgi:NAD(P)-dependent dehydrogenase (short-subunit alcohol dehydrogenase family)
MVEDGQYTWEKRFWEQPLHRWASMMDVGVRTAFLCSQRCVAGMLERRGGLIVNISFWAARQYHQNVIYGVSKAAVDKMSHDMAFELRDHGVAAVSLYPGLVRTEGVLENASFFDMSNSESPQFSGLVIEALFRDPARKDKSGGCFTSSELAREYGIRDIDGKVIADSWVRP